MLLQLLGSISNSVLTNGGGGVAVSRLSIAARGTYTDKIDNIIVICQVILEWTEETSRKRNSRSPLPRADLPTCKMILAQLLI
jgi:hypothetical protein